MEIIYIFLYFSALPFIMTTEAVEQPAPVVELPTDNPKLPTQEVELPADATEQPTESVSICSIYTSIELTI